MALSFFIHPFGCQMNRLDAELMREALLDAGYVEAAEEAAAQIVIFVTCSVREHAEERVEQRVRQIKNRGVIIAVAGCLAERLGAELFKLLPRVRIVAGTRHFPEIAALVARAEQGEKRLCAIGETDLDFPGTLTAHPRRRHSGIQGYISVMRGCSNFCAYCIVPYVRGREESRPAAEIVREAQALAARGAAEITLLGQNIDAYGKHSGSSLAELLRALDDEVPATVKRFRCVTSHPRDITAELLQTMAARPRLAAHLHMPAQSGSTRILTAMRRGYTREIYDERLQMIRELAPGTLVTSDFIVGFPGETDDDFAATVDLVAHAGLQTAYVFKYSPRPGTWSAENLPDDIPDAVKRERNQILLKTQEQVSIARNTALVGTVQEILVEGPSPRDPGRLFGRTSSNLSVVFPCPGDGAPAVLPGEIVKVKIERASALTLFGGRV